MVYMVTFTINIPPMLPYIAYVDPMGDDLSSVDCQLPNQILLQSYQKMYHIYHGYQVTFSIHVSLS